MRSHLDSALFALIHLRSTRLFSWYLRAISTPGTGNFAGEGQELALSCRSEYEKCSAKRQWPL
jgi:hypothetical protein